MIFRCCVVSGALDHAWRDPEGVVHRRRWVMPQELQALRVKPDSLGDAAFAQGMGYDPLERMVIP